MSPRAAARPGVVLAWIVVAALFGCDDVGVVGESAAASTERCDEASGECMTDEDGAGSGGAGAAGSSGDGAAGSTADAGTADPGEEDPGDPPDEDECEEQSSCACSEGTVDQACPEDWPCVGGFCVECADDFDCDDEICGADGRCVEPDDSE